MPSFQGHPSRGGLPGTRERDDMFRPEHDRRRLGPAPRGALAMSPPASPLRSQDYSLSTRKKPCRDPLAAQSRPRCATLRRTTARLAPGASFAGPPRSGRDKRCRFRRWYHRSARRSWTSPQSLYGMILAGIAAALGPLTCVAAPGSNTKSLKAGGLHDVRLFQDLDEGLAATAITEEERGARREILGMKLQCR